MGMAQAATLMQTSQQKKTTTRGIIAMYSLQILHNASMHHFILNTNRSYTYRL